MARTLFYFLPSFAVVLASGHWVLKKIAKFDDRSLPPDFFRLSAAFGIGLGLVAMLFSVLGMAGAINKWIGVALWLAGFPCLYPAFLLLRPALRDLFSAGDEGAAMVLFVRLLQCLTCAWLFIFLWTCLLLTADPDVLQNHWSLASTYLHHGSVRPVPYNLFSYFPQNAEMVYLWQFMAGSQFSSKLFNFAVWTVLILAMVSFVKNRSNAWAGWLCGAVLAFFPIVTQGFYIPKNDSFLAFFQILAVLFSLSALSGSDHALAPAAHPGRERYLLLGGLFLGAALGTKYSAFPLLLVLPVFLLAGMMIKERIGFSLLIRSAGIFAVAACLFSSAWYIRNTVVVSNPAYPFAAKIFPERFKDETIRYGVDNLAQDGARDFKQNISNPARISALYFGLGPKDCAMMFSPLLLFLLVFLWKIFSGNSGYLANCAGAALLSLAVGLPLTYFHFRSFIAQTALLTALSILGLSQSVRSVTYLKYGVTALFALSIFNPRNAWTYNLRKASSMILLKGIKPQDLRLTTGVDRVIVNDLQNAWALADRHLPKESLVLFAGETRAAGFPRKFIASSGYDLSPAQDWMQNAGSPEGFHSLLKAQGVTHLLVVPSGLNLSYKDALLLYAGKYCETIIQSDDGGLFLLALKN